MATCRCVNPQRAAQPRLCDSDFGACCQLPHGFVDAWPVLRGAEAGATFDVTRNRMVAQLDGWARAYSIR